jgi:hypothetical protein
VETATIELDSTGRLWIASDVKTTVEVRYSEGLYTSWSAPITVASGIKSDDISSIIAMPNGTIGVFWSNQATKRFGFRVHEDGDPANVWSADELPGSQSALNVGGGLADDHLHLAATSDGTVYAAVKTSYDKSGYPKIGLLVRRPDGTWDDFYGVSNNGTRPVIAVDELAGQLVIAYSTKEGGGDIVYNTSPLDVISISPAQVLINGKVNNVTTTKSTSTNQLAFLADKKSVLFSFDTSFDTTLDTSLDTSFDTTTTNLPPIVSAGPDGTAIAGTPINLAGTVSDDGQPSAASLSTLWSIVSAAGPVTFGDDTAPSTTATFDAPGTYVLRLTASDGQLSRSDEVSIIVAADQTSELSNTPPLATDSSPEQMAFQNGLFPNVTYAGTTDTRIAADKPTKNYGSDTKLTVDGDPDEAGLFRWDVAAIPSGSTVHSVTVELTVTGSSKDTYQVYALERAWDELSATWQQYATGNNWDGAGASGSGDEESSPLGQLSAASKGVYRIDFNDAGVAAVQDWINDASKNYGIIIKDYSKAKAVEIATSEAKTASQRPKLIIDFTPPAPANLLSIDNLPPVVDVGANRTTVANQPIQISAVITEDGRPVDPALLTALWTKESGPGTVTFGNDHEISTTAQFSAAGSYVLRLTVSDGVLTGFDELSVSVS